MSVDNRTALVGVPINVRNLMGKSCLTPVDLEMLRHEAVGHSSKVICVALNVKAKTIDSRSQRIKAKLDAPDSRTPVHNAKLYGLF